jgi:hypothetical protein
MATKTGPGAAEALAEGTGEQRETKRRARKEVPGNFSYTTTPGRFKDTLQAMISAERPPNFNRDFIETVLGIKGGAVSGYPPILKRLGFLSADGSPTDLYGAFQADSSRSAAALTGLKNGFGELFKRNAHVHKADDARVRDYLVQITGRTKDDQTISAILGTFNAVKSFITSDDAVLPAVEAVNHQQDVPMEARVPDSRLGLSYHINIVLPETKDISVFNAIF